MYRHTNELCKEDFIDLTKDPRMKHIAELWLRLCEIEDILGDEYDLDRLRELVQADREGRCVVLPCKVGDSVYCIRESWNGYNIDKKKFKIGMTDKFGKTVFLSREAAEAALKAKGR